MASPPPPPADPYEEAMPLLQRFVDGRFDELTTAELEILCTVDLDILLDKEVEDGKRIEKRLAEMDAEESSPAGLKMKEEFVAKVRAMVNIEHFREKYNTFAMIMELLPSLRDNMMQACRVEDVRSKYIKEVEENIPGWSAEEDRFLTALKEAEDLAKAQDYTWPEYKADMRTLGLPGYTEMTSPIDHEKFDSDKANFK